MARKSRPLKATRNMPRTHKNILEELKKRQTERKSISQPEIDTQIAVVKDQTKKQKEDIQPPKPLCVGTIFPGVSEFNQRWLDLQLKYLRASTSVDFHHVTFLQQGQASEFFKNNTEIIRSKGPAARNSAAHVKGLEGLKNYFIKNADLYKHFLFIDMDAFPIHKDWYANLCDKLKTKWEIATLLRPENLEQRLHSSVLFCDKRALPRLSWGLRKVGDDLIGKSESDVQILEYQNARRKQAYVMLRSNQHQIHPLLCGVYYDLFYHHGCGSGRNFNMRSKPYWKHVVAQNVDVRKTIDELMKNPNDFIHELAGWNNKNYAQV